MLLAIPCVKALFNAFNCRLIFVHYSQVAVVEVSSYQLEIPNKYFCPSVSFGCLSYAHWGLWSVALLVMLASISQVAVVLNLTPDHLERHKTMRNYAIKKCRLFSRMSYSKLALLPTGRSLLWNRLQIYYKTSIYLLLAVQPTPGIFINSCAHQSV